VLIFRFPSPRFTSTEPYPSILSETSPYPYPTPTQGDIKPLPLQAPELHLRLILQSIARQIDDIWAEDGRGATVLARDFMIMQVPSHELNEGEKEVLGGHLKESAGVTASWVEQRWADLKIPGIEEYQA
jgi:ribonuclease Z